MKADALVPCSWTDEQLSLRYPIPKIWTQKSSRPFGIYWSDRIGYGRLWPEPTPLELAAFYDVPAYRDYLAGKRNPVPPPRGTLLWRAVVKMAYLMDQGVNDPLHSICDLIETDGFSACDIGCGNGVFLARLRAIGSVVAGVDPSPISADALRAAEIEFSEGTAEQLPLAIACRKFDLVTMIHSLDHCRDPAAAIANAKSILAPSGVLVVEVPNMECIGFKTYAQCWWHTDAGRHMHFFSRRSLELLLSKVGLDPIRCEFQGFVAEFTPRWITFMADVWDQIFEGYLSGQRPPRPSLLKSVAYLPHGVFAAATSRYEVVRLYARAKRG